MTDTPFWRPVADNNELVYKSLGRFIYEFAALETTLRIVIIDSIEADEHTGMYLINKMDAKVCLSKLRGILRQRHKLTDETKDLLAECSAASDFRNVILHQAPVMYDSAPILYAAPFGENIQPGQKSTPLNAMPFQQLELAAVFCDHAAADLQCLNRRIKLKEKPTIVGLTKAAFPEGFPKHQTADQADAHKPDQKALETALETARQYQVVHEG